MVKLYDLILNFENDLLALSVSFVYLFYITTHPGSHQNFSDKELAWGNMGNPSLRPCWLREVFANMVGIIICHTNLYSHHWGRRARFSLYLSDRRNWGCERFSHWPRLSQQIHDRAKARTQVSKLPVLLTKYDPLPEHVNYCAIKCQPVSGVTQNKNAEAKQFGANVQKSWLLFL